MGVMPGNIGNLETLIFWMRSFPIFSFYFLGLQNHCGWWQQPWNYKTLAPWKKSYDKLSVLKSRDITLPTKVPIVKVMVFPVVMYGCESWIIKKAECRRNKNVFKLCCWRRLWRVPWTTRKSNQSILKEISPEYSLEGLLLKLQYFGQLMWRAYSLGKNPDAGEDWRQEKKEAAEDELVRQHHWLNGHKFEQTPGDSEGQGNLVCCSPWGHKESDTT